MKKYTDYKDIKDVEWTKYIIVVPTIEDRKELMNTFEDLHYSGFDTDVIAVNQLVHEYLDESREPGTHNNIIVDPEAYYNLQKQIK
jgi:hypothetical protein